MTRQCPECKRVLELNEINFRFSCDGYWRSTCRDCQNERKRKRYRVQKAKQVKKPNPYKQARERRLKAMVDKYDRILKTLDVCGVSPDVQAGYVDMVLENANRSNRKSA